MQRRLLGNTGISVSEVAFGGVEIGMPYGIGHGTMPTSQEALTLLRTAYDSGMNFFDTARMYGQSEELMGRAFRDIRKDIVLCTKCVHFKDDDGSVPRGEDLEKLVETSLQDSLTALQTDYVDVFMLHLADMEILSNEDVARVFVNLRNSGKARAIGVSVYTAEETEYAIQSGIWNVIQLPFNLLNQQHRPYFDAANDAGVGVVVRSVLMQGLLSDGLKTSHDALRAINERIVQYRTIAKDNQLELTSMATKFALHFKQISSVLVGIDRMDYLRAALAISGGKEIPLALHRSLLTLAYEDPEFINLHQWKQQGWI